MAKSKGFYPRWTHEPPDPASYRSIFKWGQPDRFKHPNARLYDLLKQTLGLSDADFQNKHALGDAPVRLDRPSSLPMECIRRISAMVGEENISLADYDRVKFATGKTAEEAWLLRQGKAAAVPDLVVHPRDRQDVQRIIAYCHQTHLPVYIYGGGSSVNLGLQPVSGGITLVMQTHMNRVLGFNETDQTIRVEPGISGPAYEQALNFAPERFKAKRRYTGGHFPQSFEHSTVGGWICALGSGQLSSYYGDMCDLVLGQEYVTPAGTFKTLDFPATATGPKLNDMMKGSEGAFGVLVALTLRIFRHMPQNRRRFAFVFPSWENTVQAAREISQGEFGRPSLLRISDPEETEIALRLYGIQATAVDRWLQIRGFKPARRCLCLGHSEGEKGLARHVYRNIRRIGRRQQGAYLTGYPVKLWERGRYQDPYLREDLNDFGILIDTLESAVAWSDFHRLHQGVRRFIKQRPHTVCMAHASHFYPQGTNLYFIFIAKVQDLDEYRRLQAGIIDTILQHGGSLSHHHGVGKLMAPWMERHLGKVQMDALKALKHYFDPHGIMNPGGTLGLNGGSSGNRPE
jgi:alkyldihydroxyacetonephosphate synthase